MDVVRAGRRGWRDRRNSVLLQLTDQLERSLGRWTQLDLDLLLYAIAKDARAHAIATTPTHFEELAPCRSGDAIDGEQDVSVADAGFRSRASLETSENWNATKNGGEARQIRATQHTA